MGEKRDGRGHWEEWRKGNQLSFLAEYMTYNICLIYLEGHVSERKLYYLKVDMHWKTFGPTELACRGKLEDREYKAQGMYILL